MKAQRLKQCKNRGRGKSISQRAFGRNWLDRIICSSSAPLTKLARVRSQATVPNFRASYMAVRWQRAWSSKRPRGENRPSSCRGKSAIRPDPKMTG